MSTVRESLTDQQKTYLHCALRRRDGSRCFYCGRNFKPGPRRRKTLDHYIPHRIWPGWQVDNLVLACEGCNTAKADVLPWPFVWLLLTAYRPDEWELTA
ncbi:HNH endonuclease [Streptomyces sp. NPDC048484]|uniref:HNH endonuclease n=1 Tax=Streptomyces sp. NPDC048484 TaxID=3155146 RepID=UPI003421A174